MDVTALYEVAAEAIDRARKGKGPTLVEAKTMRFLGHYVGDPGTAYGHDKEVKKWKKRDPIDQFRKFLEKKNWLTGKMDKELRGRIESDLEAAVEFAREEPRA